MVRLSSVLVSHFLLDLQECHQRTVIGLGLATRTGDLPHTFSSSWSVEASAGSVQFARGSGALGSLGATLGTDLDADCVWEGEGEDEGPDGCLGTSDRNPLHLHRRETIRDSWIEGELEIMEVPRENS